MVMNDLTIAEPTAIDSIRSRIFTIRGIQVMLDRDLAELYGVPTKRLNEQVRRNAERFPDDFMFHLSKSEMSELVANCDHKCGDEYKVTDCDHKHAASRHSTTLHMSIEVFGDATASHKSAEGRSNHCTTAATDRG